MPSALFFFPIHRLNEKAYKFFPLFNMSYVNNGHARFLRNIHGKNVEILRSICTLLLQCPFSVINVLGRRLLPYPRHKNSRNALDENLTVIIFYETD
jgi:hypothetical protein